MLEQAPDLESLYSKKRRLEAFLNDETYRELDLLIQGIIRSKRAEVFSTELGNLGSAFHLSKVQGEVAGLQLARVLVSMMIDDLSVDIERKLEEERDNEDAGQH